MPELLMVPMLYDRVEAVFHLPIVESAHKRLVGVQTALIAGQEAEVIGTIHTEAVWPDAVGRYWDLFRCGLYRAGVRHLHGLCPPVLARHYEHHYGLVRNPVLQETPFGPLAEVELTL